MEYNKNNKLKVFEAFGGYGSQSLALKRLKENYPDFDYEVVGYSDIEEAAITAYMALHEGENVVNYGDITEIIWQNVPDFDLFTMSSPCQDFSAAGKMAGGEEGSGTRSSIIWNVHDCVRIKRPKIICSENVAAILSGKFLPTLQLWLKELERMGYVNFMPPEFSTPWNGGHTKNGCLNSKDYGVSQNRLRWFCVSILRTEDNPNPKYYFPKPFKLEKCLADVLEEDVDESYFLSDEMLSRFCTKSLEEEEDGGIKEPVECDDFEDFFLQG